MRILSFGEVLWDVYPDNKYIGGAPLNFAAHLAKHGHEVFVLSALGKDVLGYDALSKLDEWGIKQDYISLYNDIPTGSCIVTLDQNQVPTYKLMSDVAYDKIPYKKLYKKFDVLYFGTLALRNEYNQKTLQELLKTYNFAEVFVDINIRKPFYTEQTVRFSIANATILKISIEEMLIVAELAGIDTYNDYIAFSKKLAEIYDNLKYVIVTLGEDGAYALDCKNSISYQCSSVKVDVVSTVGAGDSFSAAFLHQYLLGNNIDFSMNYASKIAGFVVSQKDAVPNYKPKDLKGKWFLLT